jgi:hypothetical protein
MNFLDCRKKCLHALFAKTMFDNSFVARASMQRIPGTS